MEGQWRKIVMNEISIINIMINDKSQLDCLISNLPKYLKGAWRYLDNHIFQYRGENIIATIKVEYSEDSWRKRYLTINRLTDVQIQNLISYGHLEQNIVISSFYNDVLLPYKRDHTNVEIVVK